MKKVCPKICFFVGRCLVGSVPRAKKTPICSAILAISHGIELKFRTKAQLWQVPVFPKNCPCSVVSVFTNGPFINYPDSHHSRGALRFATQISPLLNYKLRAVVSTLLMCFSLGGSDLGPFDKTFQITFSEIQISRYFITWSSKLYCCIMFHISK